MRKENTKEKWEVRFLLLLQEGIEIMWLPHVTQKWLFNYFSLYLSLVFFFFFCLIQMMEMFWCIMRINKNSTKIICVIFKAIWLWNCFIFGFHGNFFFLASSDLFCFSKRFFRNVYKEEKKSISSWWRMEMLQQNEFLAWF